MYIPDGCYWLLISLTATLAALFAGSIACIYKIISQKHKIADVMLTTFAKVTNDLTQAANNNDNDVPIGPPLTDASNTIYNAAGELSPMLAKGKYMPIWRSWEKNRSFVNVY